MTTSYSGPSVPAIQELSEDGRGELRSQGETSANEKVRRISRASQEVVMQSPKANMCKEREKERDRERDKERPRRYHKSTPSGNSHRHSSKTSTKHTRAKRASFTSSGVKEHEVDRRSRHGRSHSGRSRSRSISSSSSSSSESEGDEPTKVLSLARARLTSPSTISNLTSLTSTTNKSSSSSGSNSTVTQASVTKRLSPKKAEFPEAPISPAVPDPPNVFAYLDTTESVVGQDEDEDFERTLNWSHLRNAPVESALPAHISQGPASSSSSASSSHHGDDNASETHHNVDHDVDTDRTTPEGSIGDQEEVQQQEDDEESDSEPAEDASNGNNASAKIASQLAAAQQRQDYYGQMQSFGTPDMQRGPANLPHLPPQALSARQQQQIKQHPLPRAEKLPVSGYELLASQLSSRPVVTDPEDRERIKPIYRKFEALNHRVLLHLQDELSELEEQLHRLDLSDTQSRRTELDITPASRRAAAAAGGELQWHKTDILGKIGFKLAQYNQALSSFNSTRSLTAPQLEDVYAYRSYLDTVHPIIEAETRFLDPEDDLVSIYSDHVPPSNTSYMTSRQSLASSYPPSTSAPEIKSDDVNPEDETNDSRPIIRALAAALALSILVPILTFSVIPGFVGRITATSLVVGGALVALMQGGYVTQGMLFKSEGIMCAGIYGGVMIVVAGIMPA